MIRFVLRFFGLCVLALGFIFLIYDGTKSIAGNAVYLTKVQDVWGSVHQASLLALKPSLESVATVLWNPVATTFLDWPVSLVFAVVGVFFMVVGRKRRPMIGYGR